MNNLGIAITIGIIYWLSRCYIGYTFWNVVRWPMFLALPIGLVCGDVPTAMTIGASIQLIYIGMISPGMQAPADESLAACIAIPLALQTNMSPEMAVALAIPFGVMGVFIDQIRRTANAVFNSMADKYAEECNTKGIILVASVYPMLLQFPLRFIPVFLANYYGSTVVQGFLDVFPQWILHAFEVAGGILPAIGFAMTIMVIGKRKLIPFFIMGFFLIKYFSLSIIGSAIFGVCIAFIYLQCTSHEYKQKTRAREV